MEIAGKIEKESKFVYIETYGCQMNEDDSSRMLERLKLKNFSTVEAPEKADLILVNTCSIRDKAEQKVYSALGRYKTLKAEKPSLLIGVSGCVAEQQGEELLKRMPYLDIVVGTHNVHKIGSIVDEAEKSGKRLSETGFRADIDDDEYLVPVKGEVKAFVSIMRGCDNFCSYCIVPYVRGREASRSVKDVLNEVRMLSESGTREVTLVGQNVNSYAGEVSFPELIRQVAKVDGIERVRFITSHPKDISEELIYLFGEEKKLARFMHLPVQSGSNDVLKRMKRGYTVESYMEKIGLLKKLYPDMAFSTDIITGFPGETDADYVKTRALLEEVRYDNIFSFKYSPRPGTEACSYDNQIEDEVKQKRLETLQARQKEISFEKGAALIGKVMDVLVEGESRGSEEDLTGRTSCNRAVNFTGDISLKGMITQVRITRAFTNSLRGELIEAKRSMAS